MEEEMEKKKRNKKKRVLYKELEKESSSIYRTWLCESSTFKSSNTSTLITSLSRTWLQSSRWGHLKVWHPKVPIPPTSITSYELDVQLNPFMLHHSIISTTNLVSTPLVGSNNYSSSSGMVILALSRKNKIGFITGAIKKPS